MKITHVYTDHYRIPLPVLLSDSTHGEISHFGLITARVQSSEGVEGVGYTYCVGDVGGTAIHALMRDDLGPLLIGEDSDCIERICGNGCGGMFTSWVEAARPLSPSRRSTSRCGICAERRTTCPGGGYLADMILV